MKKILILNHHVSMDIQSNHRHIQLAKDFSESGYEVTIMGSTYNPTTNSFEHQEEIYEEILAPNIKYIGISSKPKYAQKKNRNLYRFLNYIYFQWKSNNFLKKNGDNFEAVIASSVHPFVWRTGYKESKRKGSKFIVEVRDLWPLSFYEELNGITRYLTFGLFGYLEYKYYNLADKIVVTAPYANKYIETKYDIDKNKIVHIPHSIDLLQYHYLNERYDIPQEICEITSKYKFNVIYLGSLSRSEGLATLIEAARDLSSYDIGFLLIGNGPEKSKLRYLKEKYQLTNVFIIDGVDYQYVPSILEKANVLYTGLSKKRVFKYGISKNKFYDYMASKKPIIFSSDVPGSLISKANCGYTVPAEDFKEVSRAIKQLYLMTDKEREILGENGFKYVTVNHERKVISNQFMKVIEGDANVN